MRISENYIPLKTLTRFGIVFAEVIIAGLLVYLTENGLYLMVVPALESLRNFLKYGITK